MRVSILGFNQEAVIGFQRETLNEKGKTVIQRIDCTDLVVLRWFADFYPSMTKQTINGKEYGWVTFSKFTEDMPVVGIARQAFMLRMQKLESFGLLDHVQLWQGGTFAYYTFGARYMELLTNTTTSESTPCRIKSTGGVEPNRQGVSNQIDSKDKLLENKPIENKHSSKEVKKKDEIEELLVAFANKHDNPEVVLDLLHGWMENRKAKRAARTDRAISANLDKVDRLAQESGMSVPQYLQEVIARGWQALYPINDNKNKKQSNPTKQINYNTWDNYEGKTYENLGKEFIDDGNFTDLPF